MCILTRPKRTAVRCTFSFRGLTLSIVYRQIIDSTKPTDDRATDDQFAALLFLSYQTLMSASTNVATRTEPIAVSRSLIINMSSML